MKGTLPELESTPATQNGSPSEIHRAFRDWVLAPEFPCVGARAAFNADTYTLRVYHKLASAEATSDLARDLFTFTRSDIRNESDYATFIAVFRSPIGIDEVAFEQRLWSQLTKLNHLDAEYFLWDSSVQSDPADPQFSFSFAGQALYVIGLHSRSARDARRFPWPVLVFNPHEQFEKLRSDGKWQRMKQTIRERDVQLQGSVNPMLSDFGQSSEARQYSGRAVDESWRAPFTPVKTGTPADGSEPKCPFAH